MFIFVEIMKTINQNINNIITSFIINEPEKETIDVNKIVIKNKFNNSVDYMSNYFAFIIKKYIDIENLSYVFDNVNNTKLDTYLLNIIHVPIQHYTSETLIDMINESYINSMLSIHKKLFVVLSNISFPNDASCFKKCGWYKINSENNIETKFNECSCYGLSDIDYNNKTIDVSKYDTFIGYSNDNYKLKIDNKDVYLNNGDKTIYYNNNMNGYYNIDNIHNNEYYILITLPDGFETQESIANSITKDTECEFCLYSSNNIYDSDIKWWCNGQQISTDNPDRITCKLGDYQVEQYKTYICVYCTDKQDNYIAAYYMYILDNLTDNVTDIYIMNSLYERLLFDEDEQVIYYEYYTGVSDGILYIQLKKNTIAAKKITLETVAKYEDIIRINRLDKNKFQITSELTESTEQTIVNTILYIYDYWGNKYKYSLIIYINQPCPITTIQTRSQQQTRLRQQTNIQENKIKKYNLISPVGKNHKKYILNNNINNIINNNNINLIKSRDVSANIGKTPIFNAFDDKIVENFFNKLKDNYITMTLVDLPYLYLYGVYSDDNSLNIVLKINMSTFIYDIFTTSIGIWTDDGYNFISTYNNIGTVITSDSYDEIIRYNSKLITSYDDEKITFSKEILPVNLISNKLINVNKNINNDYDTYYNRNIFTINTNKISMNSDITDYYKTDLYYSRFGYSKNNMMMYLNCPSVDIELNDDNYFDYPIIYGNYYTQYVLKKSITQPLSTTFNITNKLPFINNLTVKVMFSYTDIIDDIIANSDNSELYFNVLGSFDIDGLDKSEHVLDVSKKVKLSKGKINIYITSDKLKWCINGTNNELTYTV